MNPTTGKLSTIPPGSDELQAPILARDPDHGQLSLKGGTKPNVWTNQAIRPCRSIT